jgi:tRNA dimethylallyltransferase
MKKLLVILGTTSTGKTDLAINFAKKFKGELIAADSRQVYKGLDIGTGKYPSKKSKVKSQKFFWEINGVNVWMYDVVSLKKQYSVADYAKKADIVLEDIQKRKKLPILVGGTGLYIKALTNELLHLQAPFDKKLRNRLNVLSFKQLQKKLQKIAPEKFSSMNNSDQNNPRRLVRAIELLSIKYKVESIKEKRLNILKIGLNAPREILYEKINKRVYDWIDMGIVEEVRHMVKSGVSERRFIELGLEYGIVVEYLNGKINQLQMIEKMQTKVRQYAKRQITWFKKDKDIEWFDVTVPGFAKKIEKRILNWYNETNETCKD